MHADPDEEAIRQLLASEDGRVTLRARAYLQLSRLYSAALSNDDYRSATAALDQQAKLLGLYAPARGAARGSDEDLSRLSSEELAQRRELAAATILAERGEPQ